MIVPLPMFVQLAAACGPAVHVDTLAAVARTESRFHLYAINDNTSRRAYRPATRAQAVATASELLKQGHSLDLGVMQINSTNLARLGMTIGDAFEPCRNIAGGARVLANFYRQQPRSDDTQTMLRRALSGYNTGSPVRGVANGYVGRVTASAEVIVPAIRTGAAERPVNQTGQGGQSRPVSPPLWDVWANARAAREEHPVGEVGQAGAVLLKVIGSASGGD